MRKLALSDEILMKMYIEKWDGILPKVSSDNVSPFIDMNGLD